MTAPNGVILLTDKDITILLQDWVSGDSSSLDELTPLIYEQLKKIAANVFRGERPTHTLQTTALVHEAFAKLVDVNVDWKDRAHFFSLVARMMRRILVDHAKAKSSLKRGKGEAVLPLDDVIAITPKVSEEVLNLHEALNILTKKDSRKAEMLELHYFGGLTFDEMSEALDLSTSTLDRDLRFAKAWMRNQLENH